MLAFIAIASGTRAMMLTHSQFYLMLFPAMWSPASKTLTAGTKKKVCRCETRRVRWIGDCIYAIFGPKTCFFPKIDL